MSTMSYAGRWIMAAPVQISTPARGWRYWFAEGAIVKQLSAHDSYVFSWREYRVRKGVPML
jgi:hypothetical protein